MQAAVVALIAIILLGGGYFYWMSTDTTPETVNVTTTVTPTTNTNTTTSTSTTTTTATSTAATTKTFTITNQGFTFNPKTMTVKKGDRVKITYTNAGGTHDVRIDGYDVGTKVLQANQTETFEFIADEAGTFEFYCSVGNHRAMGMKGSFVVTE